MTHNNTEVGLEQRVEACFIAEVQENKKAGEEKGETD